MFPCSEGHKAGRAICGALLLGTALLAHADKYPQYEQANLVQGRAVWLENCETCHAYGIAGAPLPDASGRWDERLAKGREALYEHAIDGFFGPGGTMMPPRGGNDALTNDEVTAAVDYMLKLAAEKRAE